MAVDCTGAPLREGQECVFSRNLWRGKEMLCKGIIQTVADKSVTILVTTPQPENIKLYNEDWITVKRAIGTKVFGL